ncbi:MAG: DEAD/DEAH box helicase [Kosmotogaceae bacterium]
MSINPIVFSKNTFEGYADFLISNLNIADEELKEQVKELIAYDIIHGSKLVNGPYIYLNRPFVKGETINTFVDRLGLDPVLKQLFTYDNLHKHQEEAAENIIYGFHTIVSTGTGSGKTEAFLLPIVNEARKQKEKKLLALLIYPMNALVNDQLRRFRTVLAGTGVTFARYTGDTPENYPEGVRRLKVPSKFNENQLKDAYNGRLIPYEECLSRQEIRENTPQILLTNYAQLEYLLLRNKDLDIFRESDLRFVVMDEVHSYVGELGSEVSCLLRRLKLVTPNPEKITYVGTSATVASKDESPEDIVKRFGSRLFGVDSDSIKLVTESYVDIQPVKSEYTPVSPENINSILKKMVEIVSNIPDHGTPGGDFYNLLSTFTGKSINENNAFEILNNNTIVRKLQEVLSKPTLLSDIISVMKTIEGRNNITEEELVAEIYCYLLAGLLVRKDDEPVLRPKIHYFVRGIQNLKVSFNKGKKHISINNRDKIKKLYYLDMYGCARCGQHYFVIPEAIQEQHDNISFYRPIFKDDEVIETDSPMIVLTDNIASDDVYYEGEDVWMCERCGTVHTRQVKRCLNENCTSNDLVQLKRVLPKKTRLHCLSCGVSLGKPDIGENNSTNLIRSVSNEAVDIMILAQNMLNSVSEDSEKLLIFTDNRQECAFQAGFIKERSKRFKFRDHLYAVLDENIALSIKDIAYDISKIMRESGEEKQFEVENAKQRDYFRDSIEWFLIEEFCMSRYKTGSLENLGLALIDYGNIKSKSDFVQTWAEQLDVENTEIMAIIQNFIDHMRKNTGITHELLDMKKDDIRIREGYIKFSSWFGPEMYTLHSSPYNSSSNLKSWISKRGKTYYQKFFEKCFPERKEYGDEFLEELWDYLTKQVILVERKDSKYAINSEAIFIRKNRKSENDLPHLYQCKTCGMKTFRKTPCMVCPKHNCDGKIEEIPVDTSNYNVKRYLSGQRITTINAYEHSGQVRRYERERIEKEFKSEKGSINCIVATPTLELGVDIGKLDMALMKNVPPTPANYDQRSGRAGRRHRIAVVTTYCGKGSHDSYFFNKPYEMITGAIKVPTFSLSNLPLISKHAHSAITTKLHSLVSSDYDKALLEKYLPDYINKYFEPIHLLKKDAAEKLERKKNLAVDFRELIEKYHIQLSEELKLFFNDWPEIEKNILSQSLEESIENYLLKAAPDKLENILNHIKDDLLFLIKEKERLSESEKKSDHYEVMNISQYLSGFMNPRKSNDALNFYTISNLIKYGFFPGYSLSRGHVTAKCLQSKGFVEIDRDYNIALREFAPMSRLYASNNKYRIEKYNFYTAESKRNFKKKFKLKGDFIEEEKTCTPTFDDPSEKTIASFHITDPKLLQDGKPGDSENHRKIESYDIRGTVKYDHLGGFSASNEDFRMNFQRKDTVILVNAGANKTISSEGYGFYICPECGNIEEDTDRGKEYFIRHMKVAHNKTVDIGKIKDYRNLIHAEFISDVLIAEHFEELSQAINFMESVKMGASLALDIDSNEIDSFIVGKDELSGVVFFETVPGGSGYVEVLFQYKKRVIEDALEVLKQCDCEKACYQCLLSFWNQPYHSFLDRKEAIMVLEETLDNLSTMKQNELEPTRKETIKNDDEPTIEQRFINEIKKHGMAEPEKDFKLNHLGVDSVADFAYPDKKILFFIEDERSGKTMKLNNRQENLLQIKGYIVLKFNSENIDSEELWNLIVNNR